MSMNNSEFGKLTEAVASTVPHRNVDSEIARLKRMIQAEDDGDDSKKAIIESNAWGWRVMWPQEGIGDISFFGGKWVDSHGNRCSWSALSEGLETLGDAIKICEAFKLPYKVVDHQEPDPV